MSYIFINLQVPINNLTTVFGRILKEKYESQKKKKFSKKL
jgi:hypothetical protein